VLLRRLKEQNPDKVGTYFKLLGKIGSLSRLFSDNTTPYLNYRVLENVFCYAFEAQNCARSDNAVDALLTADQSKYGVGIKTYIASSKLQKIAEMDALHNEIFQKNGIEQARYISFIRNKRISTARSMYGFEKSIYHCVTRKNGQMLVSEENMLEIDIENLRLTKDNTSTLSFIDITNKEQYSFSKAKSTLYKYFEHDAAQCFEIPIQILEDPIQWLLNTSADVRMAIVKGPAEEESPHICLPLYSPRSADREPAKNSGLNQWNARGRERHEDEVYIPIPAWIHTAFSGFFPGRDIDFELLLPNGNMLSAKVCQANDKALMSNPNKDLGHWLLREVLMVEPGHLVTREILDEAGVDTVIVWKTGELSYSMDFRPTGTYENFKAGYLGEE